MGIQKPLPQQQNLDIVVCAPADILKHVQDCKPKAVIFYLSDEEKNYTTYIKELRDNEAFDEIPLYIYSGMPSPADIGAVLRALQ